MVKFVFFGPPCTWKKKKKNKHYAELRGTALCLTYLNERKRQVCMPSGPIGPLLKGPLNSWKSTIFKHNIFSYISLSHWPCIPKICFYDGNGDFWPFRAPLAFFKRAPKLTEKGIFQKKMVSLFFLCHIEPICHKLCFYHRKCGFLPSRALFPP